MKKREKAGGKAAKARRRETVTLKRGIAPKVARRRKPSATDPNEKIALLTRELHEALEQQTATADVLKVIAGSPGDLVPVFDALVERAMLLCDAGYGHVYTYDGEFFQLAVAHGERRYVDWIKQSGPRRATSSLTFARIVAGEMVAHVGDITAEPSYRSSENSRARTIVEEFFIHTVLSVALRKDGTLLGTIVLYRREPRPFTDKQIELVQNFAAQAVIAIENTRLLNELRQRTDDLSESLEQQTATAEVLKVISSSSGELQPVFDTMLKNAVHICEARFGILSLFDGSYMRHGASYNVPAAFEELRRREPVVPLDRSVAGRVVEAKGVVRFDDIATEERHVGSALVKVAGARSVVGVPMLKEDELVGAIVIYRTEVRPFSDKQVELLTNFAAQAVIAIENTRLLNELRELLEQQTATSEVLKVISSSPGQLEPVFQAMLENAVRICGAKFGTLFRCEGEVVHLAAQFGTPPALAEFQRKRGPFHPEAIGIGILGRVIRTRAVAQSADSAADPNPGVATTLGGARSIVGVPMFKDDALVGAIVIYRTEIRPFSDKEIELVQNFAAQAVIAIENARLLSELRESLQQQTATADVLKVISRSSFDLHTVFETLVTWAARLCRADKANISLLRGDSIQYVAAVGFSSEHMAYMEFSGLTVNRGSISGRCVLEGKTVHVHDVMADPEFALHEAQKIEGFRTALGVPLLREGIVIGTMFLSRPTVDPFSQKQVELVTTFADQAVIAIENTRLLNELRESLQQQTATADVLKVISSSPGQLEPVFQAMLENATRICEAKFGTLFGFDGKAFRRAAGIGAPPALDEFQKQLGPFLPESGSLLDRALQTRQVAHSADYAAEAVTAPPVTLGGARSTVAVPMLKDDELVGAIVIYRQEVRPFTEKQIELVKNFAAQAVIAIENTRLLNELRESLQQQTATADVLKVISSSPGELEPVFQAMLENAVRICGAKFGSLVLFEDNAYRRVALHNAPAAFVEEQARDPLRPLAASPTLSRVASTKQVIQVADMIAEQADEAIARLGGARTVLCVPMLNDDRAVGVISIYRTEVRPFSDKQVELLTNFAAQAVIAIENTRLLSELRESLQQQTATADVLKVISRSTFDLQIVLDTLVESAARLCEADIVNIWRPKGDEFQISASFHSSREHKELLQNLTQRPGRGSCVGRTLLAGKPVHIHDIHNDPEYALTNVLKLGRIHTMLGVPLLREGVPIGVMALIRTAVRPFTDKQIELVTTFADQAVIAIENVRLFESVEARTRELAKSLEDLRTAQDRLVQTEKLASLGQLTAGIAHEIKNPLNFVNNFSAISVELIDELREALAGANLDAKLRGEINEVADMLQGNLDKVVQHGKRADSIVKNMLLHSRQGSGEHRPVDINAVVEESLNLAYHGARAEKQGFNITLERSFDPTAGEVDLFPQEITRVLLNLISNGFYATTKRKADADGGNYEPTLAAATKNLGNSVEIRIRDNGTGIPSEVKEQMFNPFFTTKPVGEGTGLGLSISHDIIVKQHAGSIEVDTKPGEFTEFRIVLPRGAATIAKSGERS